MDLHLLKGNNMKIVKDINLLNKVVIVDGHPGCGKTMLSPIISSLERVEKLSYCYELEYYCALNYLKKLEIDCLKDKNFTNLSGGEQRIVMLAQALTSESKILLLDEPDSFLDIAHKKEFYEILKYLNESEGKTIITISHDLQLAFSYSKNICGIKNGQIKFINSINEISDKMISELFSTEINIYREKGKTAVIY